MPVERIRCGIVGYGPVFDWGHMHGRWLQAVPEMELVGICDRDADCAAKAARDFPGVPVHRDLAGLVRRDAIAAGVGVAGASARRGDASAGGW